MDVYFGMALFSDPAIIAVPGFFFCVDPFDFPISPWDRQFVFGVHYHHILCGFRAVIGAFEIDPIEEQ